jgi:hypothetical protein
VPDPLRYRPFRASAWVLYLALALGFCGLVIWGVVGRVLSDRAEGQSRSGASDPASCARELSALYGQVHGELEHQQRVGSPSGTGGWDTLRTSLSSLGARCQLRSGATTPLSKAYARVLAFQRLAESASTQYRQEVAPADAEADRLLRAADPDALQSPP